MTHIKYHIETLNLTRLDCAGFQQIGNVDIRRGCGMNTMQKLETSHMK